MNLPTLLFSFQGRISRQPYWLVTIGLLLWNGVINQFYFSKFDEQNLMQLSDIALALFNMAIVIWINFAVQIKRWHDRDKSGWWALINLVPLVGILWVLVECGFLRGSDSQNRFGSPTR